MGETKLFCVSVRVIYMTDHTASGHEVNGRHGHRATSPRRAGLQALLVLPLPRDGPRVPEGLLPGGGVGAQDPARPLLWAAWGEPGAGADPGADLASG